MLIPMHLSIAIPARIPVLLLVHRRKSEICVDVRLLGDGPADPNALEIRLPEEGAAMRGLMLQ